MSKSTPIDPKQMESHIREHFEDILNWRVEGYSTKQIARKLGISIGTVYIYLHKLPELREIWDSADRAVYEELVMPAIKRRMMEGFNYTEVTREMVGNKLKTTKEVDKCNYSDRLLLAFAARLDKRWKSGQLDVTVTDNDGLDESLDDYTV